MPEQYIVINDEEIGEAIKRTYGTPDSTVELQATIRGSELIVKAVITNDLQSSE